MPARQWCRYARTRAACAADVACYGALLVDKFYRKSGAAAGAAFTPREAVRFWRAYFRREKAEAATKFFSTPVDM